MGPIFVNRCPSLKVPKNSETLLSHNRENRSYSNILVFFKLSQWQSRNFRIGNEKVTICSQGGRSCPSVKAWGNYSIHQSIRENQQINNPLWF